MRFQPFHDTFFRGYLNVVIYLCNYSFRRDHYNLKIVRMIRCQKKLLTFLTKQDFIFYIGISSKRHWYRMTMHR